MEKRDIDFSLKNIPIPKEDDYRDMLIHKTESFIKRLRWKVFWHKNKEAPKDKRKESYSFKSYKTPPKDPDLEKFEEELMDNFSL